ncbi:MAG: ATP-dependent Clp protease proteolytic subunit [bacterium]
MEDKQGEIQNRYDKILQEVQQEVQDAHTQTKRRQQLIKKIEDKFGTKILLYVAKLNYPIDYNDIHMVGSMLESVGETKNIDLIIQSGGGAGTVAEKIVEMIRAYCKKQFRVIVPNVAKSAATMLALGADEIIMGVTSELGPIDAQIQIIQGGVQQWISAQSFVHARNRLEELTSQAITEGKPYQAYLVQLSALDSGFIDHCDKSMAFAKDCAKKFLCKYMLKDHKDAKMKADAIAEDLTSTSKYFTHGRTINAKHIKENVPENLLKDLNVKELSKESDDWKLLFELYLRAELFLDMDSQPQQRKGKLFETSTFSMINFFPA